MLNQFKSYLDNYHPQPLGNQRVYAVLLPLIERDGSWHVLYQIRADHISQAGQVAFPGGAVENGESYKQAAIRETEEELNLTSSDISVLGQLDFIVSEWAVIYGFVGIIHADFDTIQPNEEVERLFTIPLDTLLKQTPDRYSIKFKPTNHEYLPKLIQSQLHSVQRCIQVYSDVGENLWGFTADMTVHFVTLYKAFQKGKTSNGSKTTYPNI